MPKYTYVLFVLHDGSYIPLCASDDESRIKLLVEQVNDYDQQVKEYMSEVDYTEQALEELIDRHPLREMILLHPYFFYNWQDHLYAEYPMLDLRIEKVVAL